MLRRGGGGAKIAGVGQGRYKLLGVGVGVLLSCAPVMAQVTPKASGVAQPASAPAAPEAMVSLNLPENTPLKVLIDYYSQEFGVNVLYDDQMGNQRLTIKAPAKLPKRAVATLLESALRMKGLALADAAGQPGWKRIVALAQAAAAPGQGGDSAVVTQVFKLKYADAAKLDLLVKPFLTTPGGSSVAMPEQAMLVVTDYAGNVKRAADLVGTVDQANGDVAIEFFPVKHADLTRLAQQLDQLLKAKVRSQGGDDRLGNAIETTYDARTNQVIVIASRGRIEDAREVIKALDAQVPEEQSPVRFYKLSNATAADVLSTIRSLEGEGEPATAAAPAAQRPGSVRPSRMTPAGLREARPGEEAGNGGTSAMGGARQPAAAGAGDRYAAATPGATGGAANVAGGDVKRPPVATAGASDALGSLREAVKGRQAKVTADPNTNSIIVMATPDVQRQYEQLIKALDKRRPQVLVECTIVTLDTSNNFELGVEIGKAGGFQSSQTITFSSFGLSTADPKTGRLTLAPGLGFNGALVSSDIADVIVHALQQSTRARVSSAPRILVNDNNVGTLSSINEFPYASVNASQTVATTSFGDYAQAGTEITVTPHISEADYLQLEYSVVLSSFTGSAVTQGGTTLPPPRKSDSVQSQVTIPDGSTIVVGGLNRRNFNQTVDSVPFLGEIPVLKYLFSNQTKMDASTTLFVFIRPVILRDDQFADLKFLSEEDVRAAGMAGDYPVSEPLIIR